MTATTKSDWKRKDPPSNREELHFEAIFTKSEFEKIKQGLKPEEMEDKWFVYYEDGWLYLHRSWTGALIYWMGLDEGTDEVQVKESWVSRDEDYNEDDLAYDRQMLDFLLRRLLLNQSVTFPIKSEHKNNSHKGVFQHVVSGTGSPEEVVDSISFWTKIKRIFK